MFFKLKFTLINLILFILISLSSSTTFAQNTPKIGVVLSGGGAKGLAHIGVLKALEEMHIKVDYIAGTSMGAIVGGLYACGYNADQLDSIVRVNDLSKMLLGEVPREYTDIRQRVHNEKTILNFTYKDNKLNIPSGISSGQQVYNFLYRETYPENKTQQFENLPIPFFCMATNLLNGEEIKIINGSLPFALRASMSFPGLLSPVAYQDKLLVDGGVTNNLPAKELRESGADIIIGVSTESGLYTRKELASMANIVSQIGSYNLVKKSKEQYKYCDVLVEPDVRNLGLMDLANTQDIIEKGYNAAMDMKDKIYQYSSLNTYKKPFKSIDENLIKIDSIDLYVQNEDERKFILSHLKFKTNDLVSIEEINASINALQSTNQYEIIEYSIEKYNNKTSLCLYPAIKYNYQNTIGAAIHYDDFYKSSLLLQATFGDLLIVDDQMRLDLVVGNKFRYYLDYYNNKRGYVSPGFRSSYENNNLNAILSDPIVVDSNLLINKIKINYLDFSNEINLTFLKRTNSFVEFASGLKKLQIEADQLEVGMGEELSFDDSWYNYTDIRYYFDNLNDKQFAMKGSKIKAFASISLPLSGNSSPDNNAIAIGLNLDYLKIIRLTSNFSIGLDLNAGISLFDSNPSMTYHFATANKKLVNNIKPFPGLEFGQASGETALKIGILTRLKPSENIFISLRGDGLWLGDPINNIVTSKSQIYGASIGLGYKSIIGPLELIYGQTNQGEKLYFNLGYWF